MTRHSITPGQVWTDTAGQRIQAHGGSIITVGDTFYWYGENKERTTRGSGIWHWGVQCYSSTDLYNWTDLGSIIPPTPDEPDSPLHPASMMDRPHIVRCPRTGRFVCWLKVMHPDFTQTATVLVADELLGPYEIVRTGVRPLGMNAGDFDLVVDPSDGKAYHYFERVHSELICADLTPDLTDVTGHYSTHFPRGTPPYVREAPAYFRHHGRHHLITSGTTGYHPNPSEVAVADSYHGPFRVLGDPHPLDSSRTSYGSQISSVFRHPAKKNLYIALGDRWMPHLAAEAGDDYASGDAYAAMASSMASVFERDGLHGTAQADHAPLPPELFGARAGDVDTSIADYVWLPLRFDGEMVYIDWHDEWRVEDYD